MTTAPDTPQQRMQEYGRLFEHALAGRERTTDAAILRFTARAGVADWVRDLADREALCCPFFIYEVTENDDEVSYKVSGEADPTIQAIIDEFFRLPEHVGDGLDALLARLRDTGLDVSESKNLRGA